MTDRKHAIRFTQASITQQHQKDETDINKIMARYTKTGVIDHINKHQPHYGENTAMDYHESMDIILKADEMFSELPSKVRKYFENDPAEFLKFTETPGNEEKLIELGLAHAPFSVEDAAPMPASQEPTKTAPASTQDAETPTTPL